MTHISYFDNSTTTKPSGGALTAMMPFLSDRWGAVEVPYDMGQRLLPHVDTAYKALDVLFGGKGRELFFMSSGAEAVSTAIFSATRGDRKHVVILDDAEASHVKAAEQWGSVTVVSADGIGDAVTEKTAVVSISYANGITGIVNPLSDIAAVCSEKGALLHVDVSHVVGTGYFDIENSDIVTIAGDMIHGTKSSGALYAKKEVAIMPIVSGAPLDVANLVALGYAAKEAYENRDGMSLEVARLRDMFEEKVVERIPSVSVLFGESERLPHCSCIAFSGVYNEALLYKLNRMGVYATIGGGKFPHLHVILGKKGISYPRTAVSFSFSRFTSDDDVDHVVDVLVDAVTQLRRMSEGVA